MSDKEIALQLALKTIEKIYTPTSTDCDGNSKKYNEILSNYVADMYNTIYSKINTDKL